MLLSECVDHMVRLCQPSETNGSLRIETAKSALTTAPSDTPVMSVTFLTGEKMSSAMKRRCETQVGFLTLLMLGKCVFSYIFLSTPEAF